MSEKKTKNPVSAGYSTYPTIRYKLKLIFSCLTAIPFVVFAFMYSQIGAFSTALSGFLVTLVLILVLEGFIVFRKMAEHIERLSSMMTRAAEGKLERVHDQGETKELSMIADTFNRTLAKLESTAKELGVRAVQASTLNQIREMASASINMEEVANIILERTMKAVTAQAGYLAVKGEDSKTLHVVATLGIAEKTPDTIDLHAKETLSGLVVRNRSPILIEDIEKESRYREMNVPDIDLPRLVYLSIVAKGTSVGVLVLGREREQPPFGEEDVQFLQTLLQHVGYSVENARLYENLQHSHRELGRLLEAQRQAQDQLLSSARMAAFGELSLNIAHELNNPLTAILGYIDLILASSMDGEEAKAALTKIREQGLRASRITKSLLDFASLDAGDRVKVDLNELVQNALSLAEGRVKEGGVELDLHRTGTGLYALANPIQMEHVLFSLVSNAVNAMTGAFGNVEPGKMEAREKVKYLRIETGKKEDQVYVSFQDNGGGIAHEHLSRIFEPFFSTQNKVRQVGLGLSASYGIVKGHGGNIDVECLPGVGSAFTVTLPAA